jgi:hypothetical protein
MRLLARLFYKSKTKKNSLVDLKKINCNIKKKNKKKKEMMMNKRARIEKAKSQFQEACDKAEDAFKDELEKIEREEKEKEDMKRLINVDVAVELVLEWFAKCDSLENEWKREVKYVEGSDKYSCQFEVQNLFFDYVKKGSTGGRNVGWIGDEDVIYEIQQSMPSTVKMIFLHFGTMHFAY